jgi:hypothetical protein
MFHLPGEDLLTRAGDPIVASDTPVDHFVAIAHYPSLAHHPVECGI